MTPSVVIVGAGPVGLTLAAELTRFGVSVRLVDKAAQAAHTSRALVLWSRSLDLLDRLGCGDAFLAAGHRVHAASIHAIGGERIGRIGFEHVDGPHPYALMLPQSETERLLGEHLGSRGLAVERNTEVVRLAQEADGVTLDLRTANGGVETLRCDWVVGCDGAHSFIRHTLGLAFAGTTLPSQWVLADVHAGGNAIPTDELSLFWHTDGVLALFPITPDRMRVIADVTGGDDRDPTLVDVQALMDRRGPPGVALSDPVWLSRFHINERKVADYRAGRVFIAGDAAHVHSPAGGQGMNTGMQDAANLAWKLALIIRGEARAEPLLSSYSMERSAIGDMVLKNTGRLTALAALHNPVLQTIRDHVAHWLFGLAPVRDALADNLTEHAIHYPAGPMVLARASHDGPAPGEAVSLQPGERPIGIGRLPRFTLLAEPSEAAQRVLARFAGLVDPILRPPPRPGRVWLVRPDGYVGAVAAPDDLDPLTAYLGRLAV